MFLALAPSDAADFLVSPRQFADTEGDSYNLTPFSEAGPFRLQQVISAQEFAGPMLITSMALRSDTPLGTTSHAVWTGEIRMSTTDKSPDGLSSAFADNVGSDEAILLPGNEPRGFGSSYDLGREPQFFFTIFRFNQPFEYNPQAGNLLLEFRTYNIEYTPLIPSPRFDAVAQPADGVSTLVGNLADSPAGTPFTWGYVVQFEFTPIPEPSPMALVILGMLVFAVLPRDSLKHRR